MIAVYIALAVIGVVGLICLPFVLNYHLIFIYDKEPVVYLRILFIKINVIKLVNKYATRQTDQGKKKKKPKKKKPKEKKEGEKPKKKMFGSISDFLDFLNLIIRIVTRAAVDLIAHLHIKLRELEVRFSLGEPDKTALAYGASIQAANMLFELLQRFTHFSWSRNKLILGPDFTGENSVYRIHLDIWLKPVILIPIALKALMTYLEGKEENNE